MQLHSHTETIVEFMRSELLADDTEQFIEKIMEDYLSYRDNFEIYIQTMISQALDPSFFSEITREKGEICFRFLLYLFIYFFFLINFNNIMNPFYLLLRRLLFGQRARG